MDSHLESLDPDLQCSICLDFYFEPLTLKCRHSFCRVCLLQSTKLAPDGRSCPQCRALIAITDPLTHPADAIIAAKVAEAVPAAMIGQRSLQATEALEALARSSASALPVFVMRPGGQSEMRPGARISLHFFEPRYRILIRRAWGSLLKRRFAPAPREGAPGGSGRLTLTLPPTPTPTPPPTPTPTLSPSHLRWEGDRKFFWAERAPGQADGAAPQTALLVTIDDARFLPDGRANVTGRGIERVALRRYWIEEGTGGLWYASVDSSVELSSDSSRGRTGGSLSTAAAAASSSSGSRAAFRAAHTSEDGPAPSDRTATLRRLERAGSQGAPPYNRGDVRRCADIYLRTAREVQLAASTSRAELASLQEAVSRAETLLAEADGAAASAAWARPREDAAAWVLRHAFDRILASDADAFHRGGGARRGAAGCILS